jgi:DNA-binding transcriptional MocR family regulator
VIVFRIPRSKGGVMLPELDRFSDVPLTEQISNSIGALIASNRLRDGARLWSIRKCATTLNVSPTTVSTAYDRLVATGMVQACAAKGYFVAGVHPRPEPRLAQVPSASDRKSCAVTQAGMPTPTDWIDAGAQNLPPDWYSEKHAMTIIRKWLRTVQERPRRRIDEGDRELRELICIHLAMDGMHAMPADTLLTDSHESALDLIVSSVLHEGGSVVAEDPASARLLRFLKKRGVATLAVRRTSEGIDIDALEALCRRHPPQLVFTQSMHDPTGWSSTPANMHALLRLADRYGFMIAEDDTYGDLRPAGQVRIAQMSNLQQVLYYRSFSGYRWPMRNVTFIAGDSVRMRTLRALGDAALRDRDDGVEVLMAELLRTGRYAKQMARVGERLRSARANSARLLAESGLHVDSAGAGIFLWARVPPMTDIKALVEDAKTHRIALLDESAFRLPQNAAAQSEPHHLRFNAALSDDIRLYSYLKKAVPRFAEVT